MMAPIGKIKIEEEFEPHCDEWTAAEREEVFVRLRHRHRS